MAKNLRNDGRRNAKKLQLSRSGVKTKDCIIRLVEAIGDEEDLEDVKWLAGHTQREPEQEI